MELIAAIGASWKLAQFHRVHGERFHDSSRVRSQKASLFETEVSCSAAEGPADNHMIEHVDLQNPGSSAEPAGQPDIGFTRRRVPSYAASGISADPSPSEAVCCT